jgi:hypothetical protein
MSKRIFGDILILSPRKLINAKEEAGIQNDNGILRKKEAIMKAASIPIPPPLGVGIS